MAYLREWLNGKASIEEQGNHTMYWMPAKIFSQIPIKRWKHNRPPDEARVAEIREWIQSSKRVDGIIYLACVDNEIVCYESNHRREAFKGLDGLHNIFVDMMWTATDEDVKAEFFRLNKAISVPELYLTEEVTINRHEVNAAVEQFCELYKDLRSPNKHPQRPNFNRDNFTDDLYKILEETKMSVSEAMERLHRLNLDMRSRDKRRLSDKVIFKCQRSGLWLFAWKPRLDIADLEGL